jgi:hypothetical protein
MGDGGELPELEEQNRKSGRRRWACGWDREWERRRRR